ncbi:MAG: hypothetical protein JWN61_57, partial [Pseudonocardiales bacterium]|nr:hypothetical protein [Pseudonocardiales bacterium]
MTGPRFDGPRFDEARFNEAQLRDALRAAPAGDGSLDPAALIGRARAQR